MKAIWLIFIGLTSLVLASSSEQIKQFFKYEKDAKNFDNMTSSLRVVFFDVKRYCEENGLEFLITSFISTVEEDEELQRISLSHRQGRAFDISIKNWPTVEQDKFIDYYNNKSPLRKLGAYSIADNKQRLTVIHNSGFGWHIHVQVKNQ